MFFSDFTAWFNRNAPHMPKAARRMIAAEARERVTQRLRQGWADGPLTFDDLARKGEEAIADLVR
jgi:hypothetical protein